MFNLCFLAMEELKEFKLRDLFDKLRLSDKEFENWFKELNLLHTQRVCECGKAMCYKWIKNRRNPLWICNWRKNHNGKQPSKGFYEGTFFADSHLSIKQVRKRDQKLIIFYFRFLNLHITGYVTHTNKRILNLIWASVAKS